MERDDDFTGPAIGILGATQLQRRRDSARSIVLGCRRLRAALGLRVFPSLRRRSWVQFWWAITYYNAWFMVVNDDPLVWFYYNWGFTTLPVVVLSWWWNRGPSHGSGEFAEFNRRMSLPAQESVSMKLRRLLHQLRPLPPGPPARLAVRLRERGDRLDRLRGRRQRANLSLVPQPLRRAVRVDHPVPRPGPRNDPSRRLPASDRRRTRPRSARRRRHRRLRAARVDGRRAVGAAATASRRS